MDNRTNAADRVAQRDALIALRAVRRPGADAAIPFIPWPEAMSMYVEMRPGTGRPAIGIPWEPGYLDIPSGLSAAKIATIVAIAIKMHRSTT